MQTLPGTLSHNRAVAGTSMAKLQLVPAGIVSSNFKDVPEVIMDHGRPSLWNGYNHPGHGLFLPGGPQCQRTILGMFNLLVQMYYRIIE